MAEQRLALYPGGLFDLNAKGEVLFGLSPLWYSAALAASALVLLLLYGAPPAARLRHHVLVTALATSVGPVLPAGRRPVTRPGHHGQDCSPPEPWETDGEHGGARAARPARAPSSARYASGRRFAFAATTPDQVLLDHGRRLCGAYTRNDPRELARLRGMEGLNVARPERGARRDLPGREREGHGGGGRTRSASSRS